MDQALSTAERHELMDLLKLTRAAYGNISLMKRQYKKVSKEYHPDKGGDPQKMQRLNELFQKLQVTLLEVRSECGLSSSACEDDDMCASGSEERIPKKRPRTEDSTWARWFREFMESRKKEFEDDLLCSETLSSSEEEPGPSNQDSGFQETFGESFEEQPTQSQASFSSTPPKKKRREEPVPDDFPTELFQYLSHAIYSNKTMSAFLVYTTLEKGKTLYRSIDKSKIQVDFKSSFKVKTQDLEACLLFLVTVTKHRVSAVKHFCLAQCTVSFVHCKGVIKPVELYRTLSKEPYILLEENKPGISVFDFEEGKEQGVNWQQLCIYAQKAGIQDVLLLLGIYCDFAVEPSTCKKCQKRSHKFHYNYHAEHHANACLFLDCKSQRNICQQAVDQVLAAKRLKLIECSRVELLEDRFKEIFEEMDCALGGSVEIYKYMAAVAWYTCLLPNIWDTLEKIIQLITEAVPKKRNVLFKGPINSGKTTFASALMHLFEGKSLNLNIPADKLAFELGVAIDQFCVIFDDCKGQIPLDKHLSTGQGISNLDNLRDYLDGTIKVNLEKKHVNKRSQVFPPCIMTMNEYLLPPTVGCRFALHVHFKPKPNLKKSLEQCEFLVKERLLNSGITMLLLLLWYSPVASFTSGLQEKVVFYKELLEKHVSISNFTKMQENILQGENPLKCIVVEETEEETVQ
ncbi:large T antigen [Tree shrew polyomavirus 1]|uniref:Large T antigen n=1 Tax=Tree shrew polyomavirus 1 TaxID=2562517 RepID=A0A6P1E072_9POLY|nr:large T antigen [Tree shrew polyomavirus 1]QBR53201.1 large T antigen [Tree shrew polyomavirus 1]